MKKILAIFEGFINLIWFCVSPRYRKKMKRLFMKRRIICRHCEFYNKKTYTCNDCGCFIPAKTSMIYTLDKDNKTIDGCPFKYW